MQSTKNKIEQISKPNILFHRSFLAGQGSNALEGKGVDMLFNLAQNGRVI